eukprot:TRINITY_DN16207_c0_g1_i2.p1 TRINITY_DN16207_c0_g1~~TRINITY_DN16207_c0_g1_i2.p1  ORF type:complete len:113 (+),score=8.57 TRINITY_DN16207_c0_g1_i2:263-601(+)
MTSVTVTLLQESNAPTEGEKELGADGALAVALGILVVFTLIAICILKSRIGKRNRPKNNIPTGPALSRKDSMEQPHPNLTLELLTTVPRQGVCLYENKPEYEPPHQEDDILL